MCHFCVQHGDGKRWYLNARNYALDLESDLRHRGFMVHFVRSFEDNRHNAEAGLAALRHVPHRLRPWMTRPLTRTLQKNHFGQPLPLEECEKIFSMATNITRLPCVCRGAMRAGSNAESCCIVMTVKPSTDVLAEAFRDYAGGPDAEGFETLTKEKALEYLRRAEERGLCHTVWTFITPFIAAICNCDLPSGCLAMRTQLLGGVKIMWKGEDIIQLDAKHCSGCRRCIKRCPFSAIEPGPRGNPVRIDASRCFGCGTCRSACNRGALRLEPRQEHPESANLW